MLYRCTAIGWVAVLGLILFNLVVELPHFDQGENLGIGPKARARRDYKEYQEGTDYERSFIRSMRERVTAYRKSLHRL